MLPNYLRACLWSYDTKKLDTDKDKKLIITSVLNLGSSKATDWLFKKYSKEEIKNTVKTSNASNWNKKSLNLWRLVFSIK
ncbi:hypothetical protein HY604_02375 [Candidatus Peregrinibacteria bacterium]|nr:hypothetical protein [Candidatus Peregrinibacteria bacterium]